VVAAGISADFLTGLILGIGCGFLIAPLVRSWLGRREWVSASREADLIGEVLNRMDHGRWPDPPDGEPETWSGVTERRDAS
jgi:hypothetical protein